MKQLMWFLLGAIVMIGGQALAQNFVWQDNHGNSGTLQQTPTMQQQDWMGPSRNMQQQLNGVMQSERYRNPC